MEESLLSNITSRNFVCFKTGMSTPYSFNVWMKFSLLAEVHTDCFGPGEFEAILSSPIFQFIETQLENSFNGIHIVLLLIAYQEVIYI